MKLKTVFFSLTAILAALLLLLTVFKAVDLIPQNSNTDNSQTSYNFTPQNITANYVSPEDIDPKDITPAQISDKEAENLWCYSTLNTTQQNYYKIMLSMVRNLTEGFVSFGYYGNNYSSDIAVSFRALMNDFPEYYWMSGSYYISTNNGILSLAFKKSTFENGYGFERFEIESNREEFEDAVDLLATKANKGSTVYEKQKIIHDELCRKITYTTGDNTVYTAYGALVNGKALCEGYSRAFQLICRQIGIECILVSGGGHMWNMVKAEDGWYHTDVTWDDTESGTLYTYFNLTKQQILIDHDISEDYKKASPNLISTGYSYNFSIPDTNSEKSDYFTENELVISYNDTDTIVNEILKRHSENQTNVQICFKTEEDAENFKNDYETYVKEIQVKLNKLNTGVKLKTISYYRDTCVFNFHS